MVEVLNKNSKWIVRQTWDLGISHFENLNQFENQRHNYCIFVFVLEAADKKTAIKKTENSKPEITLLTEEIPSMDECFRLWREKSN